MLSSHKTDGHRIKRGPKQNRTQATSGLLAPQQLLFEKKWHWIKSMLNILFWPKTAGAAVQEIQPLLDWSSVKAHFEFTINNLFYLLLKCFCTRTLA